MADPKQSKLNEIRIDNIRPNPDNPRLLFDQERLDSLAESISKVGILVPLIVYEDRKGKFVILDGERRWRCAKRLNLQVVPANIIAKPSKLENILRMFNIHNVREEWELMPTARKLGELMKMRKLEKVGETKLSELTSLDLGTIRRCKILLGIPKKYQDAILLHRYKADFFIEMETKVLRKIEINLPDIFKKYGRNGLIEIFVKMLDEGRIKSVTDFRFFQKVLQGSKFGLDSKTVREIANKVIVDQTMNLKESYDAIEDLVNLSKVEKNVMKLTETFRSYNLNINVLKRRKSEDREAFKTTLIELKKTIDDILGNLQ